MQELNTTNLKSIDSKGADISFELGPDPSTNHFKITWLHELLLNYMYMYV